MEYDIILSSKKGNNKMEKKIIIFYASDQSAYIVGVDLEFRDTDGYPWSIRKCKEWCKEHGYDYEIRYY